MTEVHVPVSPQTVRWGRLPARDFEPVHSVSTGDLLIIDTLSHVDGVKGVHFRLRRADFADRRRVPTLDAEALPRRFCEASSWASA